MILACIKNYRVVGSTVHVEGVKCIISGAKVDFGFIGSTDFRWLSAFEGRLRTLGGKDNLQLQICILSIFEKRIEMCFWPRKECFAKVSKSFEVYDFSQKTSSEILITLGERCKNLKKRKNAESMQLSSCVDSEILGSVA